MFELDQVHLVTGSAHGKQNTSRAWRGAILTSAALALHNAPEGLAVGINSLQVDVNRKLVLVFAISLHNIPEGIAVAAAIYNATGKKAYAGLVALASGLVEPLAAVFSVSYG